METSNLDDVVKNAREGIKEEVLGDEKARAMNAGKEKHARSIDKNIVLSLEYRVILGTWKVGAWVQSDQPKGSSFSSKHFDSYEDALEYFAWMKCKYDLAIVNIPDD